MPPRPGIEAHAERTWLLITTVLHWIVSHWTVFHSTIWDWTAPGRRHDDPLPGSVVPGSVVP